MPDKDNKGWVRGLVDFALNQDISVEIQAQQRALEADPMNAAARLNLGILFYSQGRIEDAIGELLMSIECDPAQGRAFRKLGEIYVGLGDYGQAASYARMAADRGDPKLLEAFERYPGIIGDKSGGPATARNTQVGRT